MRAMTFNVVTCAGTPRRSAAGFTLIEILVTITVLAVVMAIGTPSFRSFTNSQSIRSTSFDLNSALTLARSEAVKRNGAVTVTRRNNDWSQGWTVTASDGSVLHSSERASNRVTAVNATAAVTFNQTGRTTSAANIEWELATVHGSPKQYRCITLDPAGLPRVTKEEC